jgi:hypothetical protein
MGPSTLYNSIFYKFEEKENYENKIINVDEFMSDMEKSYSSTSSSSRDDSSDVDQNFLEVEYSTCYNVKSLSQIMDYYELSKKNMRKDEMIQLIILFEIDPANVIIVNRRRRMWRHINELKRDKYFNKFILFNMV